MWWWGEIFPRAFPLAIPSPCSSPYLSRTVPVQSIGVGVTEAKQPMSFFLPFFEYIFISLIETKAWLVGVKGVTPLHLPPHPLIRPFLTYIHIYLLFDIHLYGAGHICIYLSTYLPILLSTYLFIFLSIEIHRYGVLVFPAPHTIVGVQYIRTTYVLRTYACFSCCFTPRPNTHPISPYHHNPILSIPILDNRVMS